MRVFRALLVRLRLIKLYIVDYGGESDWVAAWSERQATAFWRNLQIRTAGQEWLDEIDEEEGPIEAVRDRLVDMDKQLSGDAEPGLTMRRAMAEWWPPAFVATSIT